MLYYFSFFDAFSYVWVKNNHSLKISLFFPIFIFTLVHFDHCLFNRSGIRLQNKCILILLILNALYTYIMNTIILWLVCNVPKWSIIICSYGLRKTRFQNLSESELNTIRRFCHQHRTSNITTSTLIIVKYIIWYLARYV